MELFLIWILVLNNQRQSVSIFIDLTISIQVNIFIENPNLLLILKRVQARLRGMIVRNQIKVRAQANKRIQPIQDIQNNKIVFIYNISMTI